MRITHKDPNRFVVWVASGAAVVFVLALGAMIVRELFPHHVAIASGESHESEPVLAPTASPDPAAPVSTTRALGAIAHAALPATPPPPQPATAPAFTPEAAKALAGVLADPRSAPLNNVTRNPAKHTETYAYERLPPFGAAELTRDKANPAVWQISSMGELPLEDLGPRGAVHEAVVQKDDKGEAFATWYSIETGPLAPAYAAKVGPETRIISKAYLEANRADYPPSFTSVLDH